MLHKTSAFKSHPSKEKIIHGVGGNPIDVSRDAILAASQNCLPEKAWQDDGGSPVTHSFGNSLLFWLDASQQDALLAMGVCVQCQVEKHLGLQNALKTGDSKSRCVAFIVI